MKAIRKILTRASNYIRAFFGIIINIPSYIIRGFVLLVRFIEFILTGQTEYQIFRGEVADFNAVTDLFKAKLIMKDVEKFLRLNYGIILKRPVFLNLYSGTEFNIKGIIMELSGTMGSYHYENMGDSGMVHMIYLKKGMAKNKFKSILAHEMAHAFLREYQLVRTDRFLREGICRWIEYKTLVNLGEKEEAERIKRIKKWQHGRAVEKLFRIENRVGRDEVMNIIKKLD